MNNEIIEKAVKILKEEGIIVYPTDTAYGIGADADNAYAIEKMYELKKREDGKPTHIIVSDIGMAKRYAIFDERAEKIAEAFWPGALTLVLPKTDRVLNNLTGAGKTIGIRIPDNAIALSIVKSLNHAITTPSANVSGGETPYTIDAVKESFGEDFEKIDYCIDVGKLEEGKISTLVDMTGDEVEILREGAISREQIIDVLG
jgi:L-threonylcarbamoyladenylate synthase